MKAFIWKYVKGLTGCYHDEGGCVVVCERLDAARALLRAQPWVKEGCTAHTEPPDVILDLDLTSPESFERVFIFPDAGCC
jgi:hypothetical protein